MDLVDVECFEWKVVEQDSDISDQDLYTLKIHTKSGKTFTRQVLTNQFVQIKDKYKELLGE